MSKLKLKGPKAFQAKAANANMNIDTQNGIIKNVVLCQVGEAKGHGVHLEHRFLETVVTTGNARYEKNNLSKQGLKMRFGHPSMCSDAVGTGVGYARNLKVDGDRAIGDIHLSKTANKSPNLKNKTYEYLLEMAEKDPTGIMLSVCVEGGYYYQYDEDGNEVSDSDEEFNYSAATTYYAPETCTHVDFVDEGAATEGLFSELSLQQNMHALGPQMTAFLDSHPKIDQILKNDPERVISFVEKRYGTKGIMSKLFSLFNKKDSEMAKEKFDVKGTSSDGAAITVVTDNSKAAIDDTVTVDETGDPAPDGDHTIDGGQTITTTGGVITAIVKTEEEEEDKSEDGQMSSEQMSALISESVNASVSACVSAAMSGVNTELAAIKKEMGMPATEPATPTKQKDEEPNDPQEESFSKRSSKLKHNQDADNFLSRFSKPTDK